MSDTSTGPASGISRWRHALRRPRPGSGYWFAAAAGFGTVAVMGVLAARVEHARPASPLAPAAPPTALTNVPGTLWFGPAAPAVDAFTTSPRDRVGLPNLNADARAILDDLDGRWTDGDTRLTIDAKRLRGRVARDGAGPPQPIIIRDIGDRVVVADIGPQRYVLLRRPDGVAISGATLAAPLELHREEMPPRTPHP